MIESVATVNDINYLTKSGLYLTKHPIDSIGTSANAKARDQKVVTDRLITFVTTFANGGSTSVMDYLLIVNGIAPRYSSSLMVHDIPFTNTQSVAINPLLRLSPLFWIPSFGVPKRYPRALDDLLPFEHGIRPIGLDACGI